MSINFQGKNLNIAGKEHQLEWEILQAVECHGRIIVLFDPDQYLSGGGYKTSRRNGRPPVKNLIAITGDGSMLWEAEMPEDCDYYYKIVDRSPLRTNSFSSFSCELDIENGRILEATFFK